LKISFLIKLERGFRRLSSLLSELKEEIRA
jgi:hypothetical protein